MSSSHTNSQSSALTRTACPYHASILAMVPTPIREWSPMERFLAEGTSKQSSVFLCSDTGKLSINKGCICAKTMETVSKETKL
ncbi:hypothetical protein B0J11DRAFT_513665 [Dendryphion nanum]|uniref:Uncharacterized protein n=1 Tax=Dendryphion nanum TaxID=256645 RepID=A0A9P9J0Z0_9PLEO|nr:hypothetical protein B0J11DRAFT_513665 [Dendryphion nanum]